MQGVSLRLEGAKVQVPAEVAFTVSIWDTIGAKSDKSCAEIHT